MKRINRLKGKENPRFDTNTGRPFVVNGVVGTETFMKIYLDSTEVDTVEGLKHMFEWFESSRIGTPDELRDYLVRKRL